MSHPPYHDDGLIAFMKSVLHQVERPEGYQPPNYDQVRAIATTLRKLRQPTIDRIWEVKRARRGEWDEVFRHIPKAYKKMIIPPDLPQIRDMLQRVSGLIAKQPPMPEVLPPSGRPPEVAKAAKEEARLHGLRIQIEDQQDRSAYEMGIDAQAAWGESWIAVYPDPRRLDGKDYERGKDEDARDYKKRAGEQMVADGVPICMDDYDPQTVLPFYSDRGRLAVAIIETEHTEIDINLGLGYKAIKADPKGERVDWVKTGTGTLSEPFVANEIRSSSTVVDVTRDHGGLAPGVNAQDKTIRKTVFMDCWVYQCYLDGILVEQWEHNYGIVPLFPASGEQSSDRDPGWQTAGIADASLAVARQVVLFAAVMASNAMQHGFPTPFVKNAVHGLVHPVTGEPLTRTVKLGEMNLLHNNEDIVFPYLDAQMMPDFYRHMDWLTNQLEASTISNFGSAIGSDMAGYAVAQIRAMQMSILSTIYTNAARQWRKIYYFLRHIVRANFPGGLFLRGAVEEDEEGNQYRPILEYGPEHTTDYAINVHIADGIPQDEMAERKSNLEMMQAGAWSLRRVMENTGVEDPAAEVKEINTTRVLASPAADQMKIQMAMTMVAERLQMTNAQKSSPFAQALEAMKQEFLGGPGQFSNQGGAPVNAGPDGTPLQQMPGETVNGPPQSALGVPGIPGGVEGTVQVPAVQGV